MASKRKRKKNTPQYKLYSLNHGYTWAITAREHILAAENQLSKIPSPRKPNPNTFARGVYIQSEAAFAYELSYKALAVAHSIKIKHGHEVGYLYDKLPDNIKSEIKEQYSILTSTENTKYGRCYTTDLKMIVAESDKNTKLTYLDQIFGDPHVKYYEFSSYFIHISHIHVYLPFVNKLSEIALSEIVSTIKSQDNNSKHNTLIPVGNMDAQDLFRGVTPK